MNGSPSPIPRVLFDGHAVLMELTPMERTRTNGINVCDVLDAIVRLMRRPVKENARLMRSGEEPKL